MNGGVEFSRRSAMACAGASGLHLLLGNAMTTAKAAPSPDPSAGGVPVLLDHLVWLAGDLEQACAQFEAASGVTPEYGGSHPSGTHNALVSLGEQVYLEIAAPVPGAEAGHPWVDAARRRPEPHLFSYCMRCAVPLPRMATATREAGFDAYGPSLGSRTTPDGDTLEWQLFIPIVAGAGNVIPFLIDWRDTPHPSHSTSSAATLTSFEAEHPDPEKVRDAMNLLAPGVHLKQSQQSPDIVAQLATPNGPMSLLS